MNKIVGTWLVAILVFGAAFTGNFTGRECEKNVDTEIVKEIVRNFSNPEIVDNGKYANVEVEGANSVIYRAGEPILPRWSTTIKFPFGTRIIGVECIHSAVKEIKISKKIVPTPEPASWENHHAKTIEDEKIYGSNSSYPSKWYSYRTGGGIDNGKHIAFLTIDVYPIRYIPAKNTLLYIDWAKISIKYVKTNQPQITGDEYDMVIIAPSRFTRDLQPLVEHKCGRGIETKLVTTDEIYAGEYFDSEGRDDPEKIKYFIKNAKENWNVKYILLVGGLKGQSLFGKWWVPVRYSHLFWADEYSFVSDLYYADLYWSNGSFCSWDSNGNGVFGEWSKSGMEKDELDLTPDIYLGRLPCRNNIEVKIMVDKIIDYEKNTYGKPWFERMVVVGGDNFPDPATNYYEGEVVGDKALEYLDGFEGEKIYASQGKVNPRLIKKAIGKGCGFLLFHGHGSPISWTTHEPDNFDEWCRGINVLDESFFFNRGLPITIFGGCHTAMFNISIFNHPWTGIVPFFEDLSWRLTRKIGGGSIATLGYTDFPVATPGEYGDLDGDGINEPDCVEGGYGYMALRFIHAYGNGTEILGEIWSEAVTEYIITFDCMETRWDGHTAEGFVLLGDPSLKIGGYPT